MTSEQLAKAIAHVIKSVEKRILGIGASQYDNGDKQKIEDKSIAQILDESMEELEDCLAYISVVRIRIQKIRANLDVLD